MKKKKLLKLLTIYLALLLHSTGIIIAFFRTDIPFHFHLLRFFSWWSVHTSIFTVGALFRERKKFSSFFSQFITFLATIYNLVTFCFWTYCLFFTDVEGETSWLLNCQLFSGHFIAPLFTIFYFCFYARINKLRKKIVKTLLFSFIPPVFYFFYTGTLGKINLEKTSSLFPYLKKYPYHIFELIVQRKGNGFIINFLLATFVFFYLCSLVIGIKLICDKKFKHFERDSRS